MSSGWRPDHPQSSEPLGFGPFGCQLTPTSAECQGEFHAALTRNDGRPQVARSKLENRFFLLRCRRERGVSLLELPPRARSGRRLLSFLRPRPRRATAVVLPSSRHRLPHLFSDGAVFPVLGMEIASTQLHRSMDRQRLGPAVHALLGVLDLGGLADAESRLQRRVLKRRPGASRGPDS